VRDALGMQHIHGSGHLLRILPALFLRYTLGFIEVQHDQGSAQRNKSHVNDAMLMRHIIAVCVLVSTLVLLCSGALSMPVKLQTLSRTSAYIRPKFSSEALPFHDIRVQSRHGKVEQVHLSVLRYDRVVIGFLRDINDLPNTELPMQATLRYGTNASHLDHEMVLNARVYSGMQEYNSYLWNPPMGAPALNRSEVAAFMNTASWAEPWWYVYRNTTVADIPENRSVFAVYNNPTALYQSPLVFQAKLDNLLPQTTYYYDIDGEFSGNFTTLPEPGIQDRPMTIGLWADVGQTNISVMNMEYMLNKVNPDFVMLHGDLSYADAYWPLWDTWQRLMEPLFSTKMHLWCNGNHEFNSGNENNVAYMFRFATPFEESESPTFEYHAFEAGLVHVITLASFARFDKQSVQYRWLMRALERVNRTRTPWLVVQFHVPWYCSVLGTGSRLLMREAMEDLIYKYGVDLILVGHVHVYERTYPVYNNQTNPCGAVQLVLGDAGNREGPSLPFIDPQPSWSAFREGSFGVGKLVVYNHTHAYFEWNRVACEYSNSSTCATPGDNSAQSHIASDSTWLVRNTTQCPNRLMPTERL